jgi:hypothetical protein
MHPRNRRYCQEKLDANTENEATSNLPAVDHA